jgi:hypothetical protein
VKENYLVIPMTTVKLFPRVLKESINGCTSLSLTITKVKIKIIITNTLKWIEIFSKICNVNPVL